MSAMDTEYLIHSQRCDNDPNEKRPVTRMDDRVTGRDERVETYVLSKAAIGEGSEQMKPGGTKTCNAGPKVIYLRGVSEEPTRNPSCKIAISCTWSISSSRRSTEMKFQLFVTFFRNYMRTLQHATGTGVSG